MQELTSAPQMASPYTPAGGSNMPALTAQQPKLGTPIPGTTGGLAAKPGLTVYDNPLSTSLQSNPQQSALDTQSYGRGQDSMLVHMTPEEVNSLRGLAQKFGGDLTTNPHTGLPEAGWLGKLLPTILGGALSFIPGVGPLMAAGIVGLGDTAIEGDLGKGLMAGLQAFGGASIAGGAKGLLSAGAKQAATAGTNFGNMPLEAISNAAKAGVAPADFLHAASLAAPTAAAATAPAATGLGAFTQGFSNTAKGALPGFLKGAAVPLAMTGAMSGLSNAMTPDYSAPEQKKVGPEYRGPYVPQQRTYSFQTPEQMRATGGAEFTYVTPSNPVPGYQSINDLSPEQQKLYGYSYADGGTVESMPDSQTSMDEFNRQQEAFQRLLALSPQFMQDQTNLMNQSAAANSSGVADTQAQSDQFLQGLRDQSAQFAAANNDAMAARRAQGEQFLQGLRDQSAQLALDPQYLQGLQDQTNQFVQGRGAETDATQAQDAQFRRGLQDQSAQSNQGQNAAMDASRTQLNQFLQDLSAGTAATQAQGEQFRQGLQDQSAQFAASNNDAMAARRAQDEQFLASQNQDQGAQAANSAATGLPAGKGGVTTSRATGPNGFFDAQGNFTGVGPSGTLGNIPNWTPPTGTPGTNLDGSPAQTFDYGAQTAAPVASRAPAAFPPPPPTAHAPAQFPGAVQAPAGFAELINYFRGNSPGPITASMYPVSAAQAAAAPAGERTYTFARDAAAAAAAQPAATNPLNNTQFAHGGQVNMRDGSFVVDARTVSELGNGSSNAGIEALQRLGGRPVRGPGDGVSDSIPARIGGTQEARVARDEVIFSPEAIRRIGGGDHNKGTQKLYAMMDKAHKARKRAGRGQDTKLAKGLGAL